MNLWNLNPKPRKVIPSFSNFWSHIDFNSGLTLSFTRKRFVPKITHSEEQFAYYLHRFFPFTSWKVVNRLRKVRDKRKMYGKWILRTNVSQQSTGKPIYPLLNKLESRRKENRHNAVLKFQEPSWQRHLSFTKVWTPKSNVV